LHIHVIGVCGTFMGGMARLARELGHEVSGCDAAVYPPMSDQLLDAGIEVIEGFGADQLALAPDLFVVGNAVSRGNPLFEAVLDAGLPFVSGPQWVGEHVLRGRHVLAVAGTHGKTTTACMLAWILEQAGHAPGFLIGGVPLGMPASARRGTGKCFVIEADEYDTALFDKRSKFVHYFPRTAILGNLEFDHADIFPDLAAIETQFHHLVRCVPRAGTLVVHGRDEALARVLARGCWSRVERFDEPAGWHLQGGETARELWRGEERIGAFSLPMDGAHNRANAMAAVCAAAQVGVQPSHALEALRAFPGVKRRMELRGTAGGVHVYDDFAHHPTAIEATLAGLRSRVGSARILVLLEPRSNTMKLGTMQARIAPSLRDADLAFLLAPPEGRHALGWDAVAALAPLGTRARVCADVDALVGEVVRAARPGDHVVAMSNGGFGGVHARLLEALDR
jgi:UDP-N-acetylmuramate: L-alanyl-gamma-D-glutamyl-meso-diaminopimelate ligase